MFLKQDRESANYKERIDMLDYIKIKSLIYKMGEAIHNTYINSQSVQDIKYSYKSIRQKAM